MQVLISGCDLLFDLRSLLQGLCGLLVGLFKARMICSSSVNQSFTVFSPTDDAQARITYGHLLFRFPRIL